MKVESAPSKPFTLNRAPRAHVLIHGDDDSRTITKIIWSMLGSGDIKIENTFEKQDFIQKSSDAVLIIIAINDDQESVQLGAEIYKNINVIGDVMGIAARADTNRRVEILGAGFDSVFNLEMIQHPDFKKILAHKIEKARIRYTNRVMQEEYLGFRAALTASPDAFIVLDRDRRIFFVSEHYKRAYPAIGQKLIRGLPVMEAFDLARIQQGVMDDDPRYGPLRAFWERLSGEIEFVNENGRIWRIKASPLGDNQGTFVATMDITEIVSQKKMIEEKSLQLAASLAKEQEASSLQKQFIGMVSHEFRTPLAIIDGNAQLIQRLKGDAIDEIHARCKTMRSAVSRLVHMMESVLSSNMLKTGRMDPNPEEFNLGELLVELCEEQGVLSSPGVITSDVSALKGDVFLDRRMITLIVTNLLSNAVKFTTNSDPHINVKAFQAGDENIVIEISDNGIGIPESELSLIFDRYYRASTSAGIAGTGIGLNLVQDLMKIMNGTIGVQSRLGQGTRFILTLPKN